MSWEYCTHKQVAHELKINYVRIYLDRYCLGVENAFSDLKKKNVRIREHFLRKKIVIFIYCINMHYSRAGGS